MTPEETGKTLSQARISLQFKQAVVCAKTAITPPRLSKLESGQCFPTTEEWNRLKTVLHLGPLPKRNKLPTPTLRWALNSPVLDAPERSWEARLAAARASFPSMERLWFIIRGRNDASLCLEFLRKARLDSGDEFLFCARLLADGALPCRFSPLKAGYRTHPIVHPKDGRMIGDGRWPCLEIIAEDLACLVFPQLALISKGSYQLDFLVAVRTGQERFWINVEIDGSGHRGDYDLRREKKLQIATIRLTPEALMAEDFTIDFLHSVRARVQNYRSVIPVA